MRLQSKIALVTGAGGGLGGATAIRFAAEGAKVVCSDLDLAKAEKIVAIIESRGGTAIAHACDVADAAECNAQVVETVKHFDRLDILVNSAGVVTMHSLWDLELKDWHRVLDVNLTGHFLCCQSVLPHMLKAGYGRIVNMASIAGSVGRPNRVGYVAAKGGLLAMTRALAADIASPRTNWGDPTPGVFGQRMHLRVAMALASRSLQYSGVGSLGKTQNIDRSVHIRLHRLYRIQVVMDG